jgi:hypothetical protein
VGGWVGVNDLLDGALIEVDLGFEALLNKRLDARYDPIFIDIPFSISLVTDLEDSLIFASDKVPASKHLRKGGLKAEM